MTYSARQHLCIFADIYKSPVALWDSKACTTRCRSYFLWILYMYTYFFCDSFVAVKYVMYESSRWLPTTGEVTLLSDMSASACLCGVYLRWDYLVVRASGLSLLPHFIWHGAFLLSVINSFLKGSCARRKRSQARKQKHFGLSVHHCMVLLRVSLFLSACLICSIRERLSIASRWRWNSWRTSRTSWPNAASTDEASSATDSSKKLHLHHRSHLNKQGWTNYTNHALQ